MLYLVSEEFSDSLYLLIPFFTVDDLNEIIIIHHHMDVFNIRSFYRRKTVGIRGKSES